MSIYPLLIPKFIQSLFKSYIWSMDTNSAVIYLTFDDGPTKIVTEKVLEILAKYNAQATFFCIGKNVENYPTIYQSILAAGHSVGNHTYNHRDGWKSPNSEYFNDISQAESFIKSDLFRPPYGHITRRQGKFILKNYRIIMWNVLSGDFDQSLSNERCLKNVLKFTKSGSIVVFHDSLKASERMLYTLPRMLEHFSDRGYQFKAITF